MSVTNGFLRIPLEELARLRDDPAAFERRCRDYDHPDYLEMDQAGWQLLFVLDPASIDYRNPKTVPPYPGIAAVLSGGDVIHPSLKFGAGPAKLVPDGSILNALRELETLSQDQVISLALESEMLSEVLMCDVDENTIATYHWKYLQSLRNFLTGAHQQQLAVLRY